MAAREGARIALTTLAARGRQRHAEQPRARVTVVAPRGWRLRPGGCGPRRRHRRHDRDLHGRQRRDAAAGRLRPRRRFGRLFGASIGDADARSSLSYDDAVAYQTQTASFDASAGSGRRPTPSPSPGQPQHVQGAAVDASLAQSLGVQPALGRWFPTATRRSSRTGCGSGSAAGRRSSAAAIVLNGRSFTVTGIMPPRFRLPEIGHAGNNVLNDVWIPLDADRHRARIARRQLLLRLRPAQAGRLLRAGGRRRQAGGRRHRAPGSGIASRLHGALDSLQEMVVSGIRPTLLMLLAAAALLFLVTCANVAALLLARSVARARDTAVRVALGADRRRLALQFFLEGLFVSVAGGGGRRRAEHHPREGVVTMAADFVPRADRIALDWRVLLFARGDGDCGQRALEPRAALAGDADAGRRRAQRWCPHDGGRPQPPRVGIPGRRRGGAGLHAGRRQRRAHRRGAGARADLGRLRHARRDHFQLTAARRRRQRRSRTHARANSAARRRAVRPPWRRGGRILRTRRRSTAAA